MKRWKNRLDEMQEQKMLQIEHNGCWLAFWGLIVAMVVQMILYGRENNGMVAGEWIVFMCLAWYIAIACIRNGIWDRRLKPTSGVNLCASAVAGIAVGVFHAVESYREYHAFWGSVAVGVFMLALIFTVCYAGLTVWLFLYKKRTDSLENEEERKEEDEEHE